MNIHFVDAENIGLKQIKEIHTRRSDEVFIFSKAKTAPTLCRELSFKCFGQYPSGKDQADFYIIAKLAIHLEKYKNYHDIRFVLYTNDKKLISAFKFQCNQYNAMCVIIQTNNIVVSTSSPIQKKKKRQLPTQNPIQLIYSYLKQPRQLNPELQERLRLSKSEFSRAITLLIRENKIMRIPNKKKYWIRC